jgi:hypothetical protein
MVFMLHLSVLIDDFKSSELCPFDKLPATQPVSSSSSGGEKPTGPREPRPQYNVQRVLYALMTEDPLSLSSLCGILPDFPKEVIQATLDVLQVLGLVICVKIIAEGDNTRYYALCNFAKVPESIELDRIAAETQLKVVKTAAVQKRNEALHALIVQDLSEQERKSKLKDLLDEFFQADPDLKNDTLYSELYQKVNQV